MSCTRSYRFVASYLPESHPVYYNPISDYRRQPLVPLEEAVKDLVSFVPGVEGYAAQAKKNCKNDPPLSRNESAAIYLYTKEKLFFERLNDVLRLEYPDALKPWFPFLKLFMIALQKLPPCQIKLWRGVADITNSNFKERDIHTWWSVTSCTLHLNVAGVFADQRGTLFCIDAIYGRNIAQYSAFPKEEEIVLMPGTLLRVKGARSDTNGLSIVDLEECPKISQGKHVMLSYTSINQDIVSKIADILKGENIPVWFDSNSDMKNDMYESLANGVENAAAACCFLTSDYEQSLSCQSELQYAQKRQKPIIPCMLTSTTAWKPSGWLESITTTLTCIDFQHITESNIDAKVMELIDQIEGQIAEKQNRRIQPIEEPIYLFELIKLHYKQNSRIERLINPAESFPIDESYINLTIVDSKEQQEKEKKLGDVNQQEMIMGTYEDIYGVKTRINVEDMFKTCKEPGKKVLVFGRAGIGKTTLCRYIAHQWATDALWPEYNLVALVSLRSLTENRYSPLSPGIGYSLVDIVARECLSRDLSEEDKSLLKDLLNKSKVLWLLDGYDEIIQNVPSHLQLIFEQLLNTPHHIVTSRSYFNTLSHSVRVEIVEFTDKNISKYVDQFFHQLRNKLPDASSEGQKVLNFLRLNPRIWGIAHIPVNLELICSIWTETDWSETTNLTMTTLYENMTVWLCWRYLARKSTSIQTSRMEVYEKCRPELTFLETLAFEGMTSNSIILRKELLQKVMHDIGCLSDIYSDALHIGILKSFDKGPTGNQIQLEKHPYFVHLSFQEFFAARYLVRLLSSTTRDIAIQFIGTHKYEKRLQLVFIFASGLLIQSENTQSIHTFWDTIFGDPHDLVGIRQMQLVAMCLDETQCDCTVPHRSQSISLLLNWIRFAFSQNNFKLQETIAMTINSCSKIQNLPEVQIEFASLLKTTAEEHKSHIVKFITHLKITDPHKQLLESLSLQLEHNDAAIRTDACIALGKISENAATSQVIDRLVVTLADQDDQVRRSACSALGAMGEKAATSEVIDRLVVALCDHKPLGRLCAFSALERMVEEAARSQVIDGLVMALGDQDGKVRSSACSTLVEIGIKAATSLVIDRLVVALGDQKAKIRASACSALGAMAEKAATSQVIDGLVVALGDQDGQVRSSACSALERIGKEAATSLVIDRLVVALGDQDADIRSAALKGANKLLKLVLYSLQSPAESDAREAERIQKSNVYDGIDGMSFKLFRLLIYTHDRRWLPIFVECCLLEEIAVMVIGDRVIMHFEGGPVETQISNLELLWELCNAFDAFGLKVLDCRLHCEKNRYFNVL
ncbi:unnamed protein product [Rotaria socialis]